MIRNKCYFKYLGAALPGLEKTREVFFNRFVELIHSKYTVVLLKQMNRRSVSLDSYALALCHVTHLCSLVTLLTGLIGQLFFLWPSSISSHIVKQRGKPWYCLPMLRARCSGEGMHKLEAMHVSQAFCHSVSKSWCSGSMIPKLKLVGCVPLVLLFRKSQGLSLCLWDLPQTFSVSIWRIGRLLSILIWHSHDLEDSHQTLSLTFIKGWGVGGWHCRTGRFLKIQCHDFVFLLH